MVDPDAYYVGFVLGDGSCAPKNKYRLRLYGTKAHLEGVVALKSFGDEKWYPHNVTGVWMVESKLARVWWIVKGMKPAVSQDKQIPEWIMEGSADQRWSCLCGLMDTDGHLSYKRGDATFGTTSEVMAKQVQILAASLGLGSSRHKRQHIAYTRGVLWTVFFGKAALRKFGRPITLLKPQIEFKDGRGY